MTDEEAHGAILTAALVVGLLAYTYGRWSMRRDLLAGLDSALRIIQERKE